MLILYCFIKRI